MIINLIGMQVRGGDSVFAKAFARITIVDMRLYVAQLCVELN